jgi:hypothetical protein
VQVTGDNRVPEQQHSSDHATEERTLEAVRCKPLLGTGYAPTSQCSPPPAKGCTTVFAAHLWSLLEMEHGQLFWAPEGSRTRKVSVIPKGDARHCGDIEVMGLTPLGGVACAEVLPLEPNPPRP